MCRCAVASPNRASAQGEKKTRAVRRVGSPWQAWAGCRARLRTRCRWVDLGVARSLRRSRSSRHCAHISSLAAAVDVDDAAETLATGDGAMRSRHAVAAGELAGHIQAASRATRRRQALIQRHERSVLSSQHVYGGRQCGPRSTVTWVKKIELGARNVIKVTIFDLRRPLGFADAYRLVLGAINDIGRKTKEAARSIRIKAHRAAESAAVR